MNNREFTFYICGKLSEVRNLKKINYSDLSTTINLITDRINLINNSQSVQDNIKTLLLEDSEATFNKNANYEEDDYYSEKRKEFNDRVDWDTDLDQQGDIW